MPAPPFDDWVESIFRRPVTKDGWWWDESQPPPLDAEKAPAEALELLTRLFRNPDVVSRFTNQELGQGFWFLFAFNSSYMDVARNTALPEQLRVGCVESIFDLNRDLLAARCGDSLVDDGPWSLVTTTFMLWDLNSALYARPEDPAVDAACLRAMTRTLSLQSSVCRRSALHGLGHWASEYPDQVGGTIDAFLARKDLLPDEREYAMRAREGNVP
jgi:hypothetical protein